MSDKSAQKEGHSNDAPIELSVSDDDLQGASDLDPEKGEPDELPRAFMIAEENENPITMKFVRKFVGIVRTASDKIKKRREKIESVVRRATTTRGDGNASITATSRTSKAAAEVPGLDQLNKLIWNGEYEAFQDPYRGISFLARKMAQKSIGEKNYRPSLQQQQNTTDSKDDKILEVWDPPEKKIVTPWDACRVGILSNQYMTEQVAQATHQPEIPVQRHDQNGSYLLDPRDPEILVRSLTEACCPSLIEWTRQQLAEEAKKQVQKGRKGKGKKRARSDSVKATISTIPKVSLGRRPLDRNYHCPCDFNPFCLVSLGGVMDDVLQKRCQQDIAISIPNHKDSNGKRKAKHSSYNKLPTATHSDIEEFFESKKNKAPSSGPEVVIIDEPDRTLSKGDGLRNANLTMDSISGETDVFTYAGDDIVEEDESKSSSTFIESKQELLTCKRLRSKPTKTACGEPADVYTEELDQQHLGDIKYSQDTKLELARLRKPQKTKRIEIERYVQEMIAKLNKTTVYRIDGCVNSIIAWNKSLLFNPPTMEEQEATGDEITIALPPGIQNLGATCYLNTQLQCLAQNPVFLEGIFSWRALNIDHNMNGVMTKLQTLLAQMVFGGVAKLSTLEFSDALGLEHYEQQDPNEFARLLFDRMEESFQQCSNGTEDTDADLSGLLKRIFHGTTTYETTCLRCRNVSVRSEGFMDLNVPIVCSGYSKTLQNTDKTPVLADTDVQYCLDRCYEAEVLDGDNQYFCEKCNSKQDAERVPRLTELPPVLNVQLSRYVFDREKLIKKKLSHKVLLPLSLSFEGHDASGEKKTYALCAVMRHQGMSAYSGHYIAEAMDWTTGQWYEFNDETVKVLLSPSCSYIPNSGEEGVTDCHLLDLTPGSQDAYNMYYVTTEFLAQIGMETIKKRKECIAKDGNGQTTGKSIIDDIVWKRDKNYSVLGEMCMVDWQVSDRLRRRKIGIQRYMLVDMTSLFSVEKMVYNEPKFWVDGDLLRRFLLCDSDLDDLLKSCGPIICQASFRCIHGRLAPAKAIQGKVISKSMFDAFSSLLMGERKLLNDASPKMLISSVAGYRLDAAKDIVCPQCSQVEKDKLTAKIELLRDSKDLFIALREDKVDDKIVKSAQHACVVPKRWISRFKKNFVGLLKSVASYHEGDTADLSNSVLGGVGNIDLSSLFCSSFSEGSSIAEKDGKSVTPIDDFDERVNSVITCAHGNCKDYRLNTIRLVSLETWAKIIKVFPTAIVRKVSKESGSTEFFRDDCRDCLREKNSLKSLQTSVEEWGTQTCQNFALKKILAKSRSLIHEISVQNFHSASNGSRLLHRDDILNFRKAAKTLSGALQNGCAEHEDVRDRLRNVAFPPHHSVVLDFETESVSKLLSSLRSLICRAHKRSIKSALFQGQGEEQQLAQHIVVLSKEEYDAYTLSLAQLLSVLDADIDSSQDAFDGTQSKLLTDLRKDLETYHPSIRLPEEGDDDKLTKIKLELPDGDYKIFVLSPDGVCSCDTCQREFAPALQMESCDYKVDAENVSLESDCEDRSKSGEDSKTLPIIGAVATDPIVVESDSEHNSKTKKMRTFEFDSESELRDALVHLRIAAGQSNEEVSPFRRSSRKRKVAFPVGCITNESYVEAKLEYNIAAVRLLLYERSEVPVTSKLYAAFVPLNAHAHPHGVCLEDRSNETTLHSVLEDMQNGRNLADEADRDFNERFFLLYQKMESESCVIAALMDSLLHLSNTQALEKDEGTGKRKRNAERGFRGTLLQSSSSAREEKCGVEIINSLSSDSLKKRKTEVESPPTPKTAPISDEEYTGEHAIAAQIEQDDRTDSDREEATRLQGSKTESKVDEKTEHRERTVAVLDYESEESSSQIQGSTKESECCSGMDVSTHIAVEEDRYDTNFDAISELDTSENEIDRVASKKAVERFPHENEGNLRNLSNPNYSELQNDYLAQDSVDNLTKTDSNADSSRKIVQSHRQECISRVQESSGAPIHVFNELMKQLKEIFSDCDEERLKVVAMEAMATNPSGGVSEQTQIAIDKLLDE